MMDFQNETAALVRMVLCITVWLASPLVAGQAGAANAPAPKAPVAEAPKAPVTEAPKTPAREAPKASAGEAPKTSAAATSKAPVAVTEPDEKEEGTGKTSSLPVPRFVSLRTEPINLRTGPGVRYPVEWVYVRKRLPVEVIGEYDTWRRIRDPDGTEGWVHQSMLSGRRTATVTQDNTALRREGSDAGAAVARLESHVIVNVQRCPAESTYCRIEVSGMQGWIKREALWGVYPTETVQ